MFCRVTQAALCAVLLLTFSTLAKTDVESTVTEPVEIIAESAYEESKPEVILHKCFVLVNITSINA